MDDSRKSWSAMIKRCHNKYNDNYSYYGGRGIKVCDSWKKFEGFYADMGDRPTRMTLDRKDSNGNYEPSNCRWATKKEQANNRRSSRFISHEGATLTVKQWADRLGIKHTTLDARLNAYGWSVERALGVSHAR